MNDKKVLVVDDEEAVRDLVREVLEAHGYQVCLAENGVEGVLTLLAERDRIGFIIMDIMMPRLNGMDSLRIMKKIAPEVLVVTLTGHAGSGEMADTVRLGALTCMSKPFKIEDLLKVLDQHCGG